MRRTIWMAVLATAVLLAGAGLVSRPGAIPRALVLMREAGDASRALAERSAVALGSGVASLGPQLERLRTRLAALRPDGAAERPATGAPWTPGLFPASSLWIALGAGLALAATALALLARPRGRRAALGMLRRGQPLPSIARRTHLSLDALRTLRRHARVRAAGGRSS